MAKFVLVILVVVFVALYGYRQRNQPIDSRQAIEAGIQSAKKQHNLSNDEEQLLRLQLAIVDHMTHSHGDPPNTLNDLIPKYFSAVPTNPATGKPYEYERDGRRYRLAGMATGRGTQVASKGGTTSPAGGGAAGTTQLEKELDFINPNTIVPENFNYDSANKRDPYMPFDFSSRAAKEGLSPLEQYTLGQLRVTAVLGDSKGGMKAIIEDQSGKGYTVAVGTKVGTNNGVIVEILKDTIRVLETQQDFTGKEVQRVEEMKIAPQAGGKGMSESEKAKKAREKKAARKK